MHEYIYIIYKFATQVLGVFPLGELLQLYGFPFLDWHTAAMPSGRLTVSYGAERGIASKLIHVENKLT